MRQPNVLFRGAIALILVLTVVAPLAVVTPVEARDAPPDLDLAAVALTSEDVNDAGYDDFGAGRSEMQDALSYASFNADPNGVSEDDILDLLEETGFVRGHAIWFYDPPDDEGVISRSVFASVTLFEDADGAEEAFEVMEDESGNDLAEDLDDWDDFGDLSEGTFIEDEAGAFIRIDVSVLVDNLILVVSNVEWETDEFDEDALVDLVDIAIDRIEIGLDAEQPALSNMVLRFDGYYARRDFYLWRDDIMNRFYDDEDDDVDWRIEQHETSGQIEHFQMSTQMADLDEDAFDLEFWQYVDVFRFEDEAAAEDWFAERADYLEENEFFATFEFEDADVGDESFFYNAEGFDTQLNHYNYVVIRVGELAVELGFGSPVDLSEVAEIVATDQAACLEDDGCVDRIPLPAELNDVINDERDALADDNDASDDEEEDRGNDEETTDEDEEESKPIFPFSPDNDDDDDAGDDSGGSTADTDLETYEGEHFGFTVSYDPAVWTIVATGDLTEDGEEFVRLVHETAVQIFIIATEAFDPDDLEGCLAGAFDLYGWGQSDYEFDDAEEIEIGNDTASFVIPAVADMLGLVAGMSGECRAMDDAVLTIFTYLPAEEDGEMPEESIAIAREVIDTITID